MKKENFIQGRRAKLNPENHVLLRFSKLRKDSKPRATGIRKQERIASLLASTITTESTARKKKVSNFKDLD